MKGVARINFPGGALFVPAKTPYDRELLFESLDLYARRHGTVRVEMDRRRSMTVRTTNGPEPRPDCSACGRGLDHLTYALGNRTLCGNCARRDVK